ncbi:MAG: hypothetical protein OJJ21_05395 [Ferrovibrio sp.]|uniref:hypothetical protein n=1 Tax=Ferrovibrio sp. TaxID=1917215 RepID=UPI00260E3051|nr:hypothetical protein [Ferrovibrio sp.]MCW0233016.1 hypothetical protein [Ferrovibrio sp.]
MTSQTQDSSPPIGTAAVSAMLVIEKALSPAEAGLSPLDRLVGMRMILQAFCAVIRSLSNASPALFRALAPGIASFLSHDFINIVTEEQEGLLVYLRRRLMLGDDLDTLINHLHDEHRQDCEQARMLGGRCREFATGTDVDWPDLLEALSAFAEQQRRHLTWEDATILPIARARLQADDLDRWDIEMGRRYHLVTCAAH